MTTDITVTDSARLHELEARVENGFRMAAEALETIRDERLYAAEYATFDEYLQARWQRSRTWVSRIIKAAHIVNALPNGDKLTNESQARALRQFPGEYQRAIVDIASALATSAGGALTAGRIERVGRVIVEAAQTGHIDTGSGVSTPLDAALTVEEYEALQRQRERIQQQGRPRRYIMKAQAIPAAQERLIIALPDDAVGSTVYVSVWTDENLGDETA